jgi:GT2 family glycosyltransferase
MTQNTLQPFVAVVIVNWNRPSDTIECLKSLESMTYGNYRIIVVDNGSNDESPEKIHMAFPHIDILVNAENLGFSRGVNVGIERALEWNAEYVLLLNNDTTVAPNFLKLLVAACEADPLVGIAGPKVYYFGTQKLFSVGGWRRRFLPLLPREPYALGSEDRGKLEKPQKMDYIWGQAMLIRRATLDRIGLFDPGFFMYCEDCDFCLRASQAGFRSLYVPQAHIWHKVAHSTSENEWLRWRYKAASMLYFHRKYSCWGIIQAALQTVFTLAAMGTRNIKRGNLKWMTYPLAELRHTASHLVQHLKSYIQG